jgi:hypothetical protein
MTIYDLKVMFLAGNPYFGLNNFIFALREVILVVKVEVVVTVKRISITTFATITTSTTITTLKK